MENYKLVFGTIFRGGTDMYTRGRTNFDLDYQQVLIIYKKVLDKIRRIENGLRQVL